MQMIPPMPLGHPQRERLPLLLSLFAVIISSCSLFVALISSPHPAQQSAAFPSSSSSASVTEPLAAKRTNAVSNPVRISGLVIQPGELAAGAVGTDVLADRSVTSDKIAEGTIEASHLSHAALVSIAERVTRGQSVVGEVDEVGHIVRGTRFAVERTRVGEYELTFDEPFLSPPVVVAVAQSYGTCYLPPQTIKANGVRIKCLSDLLGNTPQPANTRFSFYAASSL